MNYPMFIKLCGQEVLLLVDDPAKWTTTAMGRSNISRGEIVLRKNMPVTVSNSVLLHEIIHYIADTQGFKEFADDEKLTSVLANSLLAWMRDNPELIKQIVR